MITEAQLLLTVAYLIKITYFLQNPVLQLLQKIQKTLISPAHDINFDQYSILYFDWLPFPSFLTGEPGKNKRRGGGIGQSYQGTLYRSRAW